MLAFQRIINSCALLLIVVLMAFAGHKLVKVQLDGGVIVMLPEELTPMIPDDIALRFPSVRKPLGAFTDENRLIDFSVNISATQWPDNDLTVAKDFFKAGVYNMYDKIDPISEGVYEVHKKRYIYFEFLSRLNGGKVKGGYQSPITHYTFIQYLVEPKRSLVFSFHCPQDQQEEWQPVAHEIMKSIRFK